MPETNSVIKTIWYSYLTELSHAISFPNIIRFQTKNNMTQFIVFRLRSEAQYIYYVGKRE